MESLHGLADPHLQWPYGIVLCHNPHLYSWIDYVTHILSVGLQFEVNKNKYKFPHWDEIEAMFAEDDE